MADLQTTYMGMLLPSPLVASSSPLSRDVDTVARMAEEGAGAVVLHSLFEEQVTIQQRQLSAFLLQGTEHYAEALTYFPDYDSYHFDPDTYLEHIARLKRRVSIPVIGSLNGTSPGGWTRYAAEMEQAGADALELNLYFLSADPSVSGSEIEQHCIEVVSQVKQQVRIPVAVKLSPFFSSIPNVASRLQVAGADALVLFNRFYQPDIDADTMTVSPNLRLSSSDELRLRLRWAGLLFGRVHTDLALTGGVHTHIDAIKVLMAGGTVAMMTSALLRHGPGHLRTVRDAVAAWLENRSYESAASVRGVMSQRHVAEPAAYERANYLEVLGSYEPRTYDQLSVESHR